MTKAFIFDLDGVLLNNEIVWEEWKLHNYPKIYGEEVAKKLGPTVGKSIDDVYLRAAELGSKVDREAAMAEFRKQAEHVYRETPLTPGLDKLGLALEKLDYRIGIVSASPVDWINLVVQRLPFKQNIQIIISLHERPDLAHKPAPDGYNEAIRSLGASPENTLILEDANPGIASAKASGAKVIGLKQNLLEGYKQRGADTYADTIEDVIAVVRDFKPAP